MMRLWENAQKLNDNCFKLHYFNIKIISFSHIWYYEETTVSNYYSHMNCSLFESALTGFHKICVLFLKNINFLNFLIVHFLCFSTMAAMMTIPIIIIILMLSIILMLMMLMLTITMTWVSVLIGY